MTLSTDNFETRRGPVLVTGAADRIGAAIASRLAFAGYEVVVHYNRSGEQAEALAQAIESDGGRAEIVQANLADRAQRATLIDRASKLLGPLTALVNNASIFVPDSVETLEEELWDTHFAVHTEAPVFLARDFVAQLPDAAQGNIINIIDSRLSRLSPSYTSYTLSKSALWTATQTMAQSLAPRVRVNAIGPGPTLPEVNQSELEFQQRVSDLPLRRGATPDDIAEAVLYLLGAKAITGQMFALDGGSHLEWPTRGNPTPRQK